MDRLMNEAGLVDWQTLFFIVFILAICLVPFKAVIKEMFMNKPKRKSEL